MQKPGKWNVCRGKPQAVRSAIVRVHVGCNLQCHMVSEALWSAHLATAYSESEHGTKKRNISNICSAMFLPCFGPIPLDPLISSFWNENLYLCYGDV